MLQTKGRRKENFLAFLMSFFTMDTRSTLMKNLAVIHWDTNDFLAAQQSLQKEFIWLIGIKS